MDDLKKGFGWPFQSRRIVPVMISSALHNIGSDAILNLMVDVFPDPAARGSVSGYSEAGGKGNPLERKVADKEPLSVFVFKTLSDPFIGRISYFKVMSGVVRNDADAGQLHARRRGTLPALASDAKARPEPRSRNCTPATSARSPN